MTKTPCCYCKRLIGKRPISKYQLLNGQFSHNICRISKLNSFIGDKKQ